MFLKRYFARNRVFCQWYSLGFLNIYAESWVVYAVAWQRKWAVLSLGQGAAEAVKGCFLAPVTAYACKPLAGKMLFFTDYHPQK